MPKLTKVIATIGPATETEEIMKELILAGMDVARFNTKHGTPEWHLERIHRIKAVAKELNRAVGVLLDLQGPEIRINLKDEKSFEAKKNDEVKFVSTDPGEREMNIPQIVIDAIQVGDLVSIDDGICEFEIVKKTEKSLTAKTLNPCVIKHRKTMNTPGIVINMPSLIDNDLVQLDNMTDKDIDFVGLSFVRNKKDIAILRDELKKRNLHADVISKIENQAALDNLDEIIEASDGVMVARGDLAVEVPFEQLAYWQKLIIEKSRTAGKPVITATQMLESMTFNPRPTRAEVSDVANAIYDGTDAVMLSGETTLGKYPVKCVETQSKIALFNEPYAENYLWEFTGQDCVSAITCAAFNLLANRPDSVDKIVLLTRTGRTAKTFSRFRPGISVKALTANGHAFNKLSLAFAIDPILVEPEFFHYGTEDELVNNLKEHGIVKKGEKILIIASFAKDINNRRTDSLALVQIE
ncbi:MAG TPA: pyruvate kinase [Candidatus Woesebacteria bacterium]|nr:pyruvate kinase [Candidatus Woesebacteria bacterium]